MPLNLPTANAGGDIPQVDDGLALLRFDDIVLEEHPDWAGTDKFGKPDDGRRFKFLFTLLDEDRNPVIPEGADDPDAEVVIDAMTRTATGEKSNFAALLGGILTPVEFEAWKTATADKPFDASGAQGRVVNGKIAHNKKGYPFVEAVIGIAKAKGR